MHGDLLNSSVHRLANPGYGLHPAEAFFNPFPDPLADGIVWMVGRPAINGRPRANVAKLSLSPMIRQVSHQGAKEIDHEIRFASESRFEVGRLPFQPIHLCYKKFHFSR